MISRFFAGVIAFIPSSERALVRTRLCPFAAPTRPPTFRLALHHAITPTSMECTVEARAQALYQSFVREHRRYDASTAGGFAHWSPLPGDVVLNSCMKSGTTLMQQLVYQLMCATGRVPSDPAGELFDDISEVVPSIEAGHHTGCASSRHPYTPRAFKSHIRAGQFDGRQRYFVCVRDARRVAASLFDFALNWLVPPAREETVDVRAEAFKAWTRGYFLGERMYFDHVQSWMEASRGGWRVMFVVYEDMCAGLEDTIRAVAKFIDVDVDDDVVALVKRKCAREHMLGDARFNDNTVSKLMGWDKELGCRVRPADAKGFKDVELPDDIVQEYDRLYRTVLNVKDFHELRNVVTSLNTYSPSTPSKDG